MLFRNRDNRPSRLPEILFFRTQLGHYAGCLILGNVFISTAGLINLSWLSRSGLSQGKPVQYYAITINLQVCLGSTCSTQGEMDFRGPITSYSRIGTAVLMQIGLWGTCWFTAVHGIHTLVALVFRLRQARWCSVLVVSVGWTTSLVAGKTVGINSVLACSKRV